MLWQLLPKLHRNGPRQQVFHRHPLVVGGMEVYHRNIQRTKLFLVVIERKKKFQLVHVAFEHKKVFFNIPTHEEGESRNGDTPNNHNR
mmetsp:Transcript_2831/g.3419  ORF Transcript_2831/g.3419 Transcript_2831/m.3419 type:complete len:88 (-) Transcript_2831:1301-1564(-)